MILTSIPMESKRELIAAFEPEYEDLNEGQIIAAILEIITNYFEFLPVSNNIEIDYKDFCSCV
jgi:hypothetical protein